MTGAPAEPATAAGAPDAGGGAASAGRDWDAASYDRVSDPQYAWALEVLGRLPLEGGETVLDAGCGSGRVTAELVERLPRGRVIGVDAAPSMVEHARAALGDRATILPASDLVELELEGPVDAVFSNAVFHWIPDHELLFARLHAALRPGGRLVAQCGGEGNVERLRGAISAVYRQPEFAGADRPPRSTLNFASPEQTRERLEAAGFAEVRTWLEPKLAVVEREFLRTVTLGPQLTLLAPDRHDAFVDAVADRMGGEPVRLDYVRLNIDAVRPPA